MFPARGRKRFPGLLWVWDWGPLPSAHSLSLRIPRNSIHSHLIQEPQMENLPPPTITTWNADPSAPNMILWAQEEPPEEAGSLCPPFPAPVPSSLRPQSRMLRPRAHRSAVKGSLKCLPPPFLLQVFNSGLAHINSLNRCIKHTHTHTDRCTPPQQGVKTHTEKPHKT